MKTRKTLAIFMAIAMVFCYMPTTAFADNAVDAPEVTGETTNVFVGATKDVESAFTDMPKEGYWSTKALEAAVNNGLLKGFSEKGKTYIKPNDSLTRAQMATIVNRAFGTQEILALSGVNDVSKNAWYYKDMQKAVKMGTMKLDTLMRPNDSITRQEAFTVLGRALKMKTGSQTDLAKFNDGSQVASWAVPGMGAMVKAGYIKGDNNLLNPKANITRAEFATIMDNVIKQYITTSGTVTQVAAGNVMVNSPGVTLQDVTITGDLIIGDGVGDGTISLKNVVVKGDLIARGGGVDSIIITGGSVNGKIIIAKIDGKIRVFAEDGAEIEVIEIDDGKDDVIIEGTVGTVEVTAANTPVIIRDANVKKIDVKTEGAGNITVDSKSKVDSVVVGASSTGTKVDVAGTVTDFETSARNTGLSGTGKVDNATTNKGADGSSVTTPNTKIKNDGATGIKGGGGTDVPANTTVANNAQGTGTTTTPVTGGGGGTSVVQVSAISVDKTTLYLDLETNTSAAITATVSPGNATNKNVTWSSSDKTKVTVDANGNVTAVAEGEATITATSNNGKKATTTVTVLAEPLQESTVAVIDTTQYDSLQEAVTSADNGDIITILKDVSFVGITTDAKSLTFMGTDAKLSIDFPVGERQYQTYSGSEFSVYLWAVSINL